MYGGTLSTLLEDLGLVPYTHMAAYNICNSSSKALPHTMHTANRQTCKQNFKRMKEKEIFKNNSHVCRDLPGNARTSTGREQRQHTNAFPSAAEKGVTHCCPILQTKSSFKLLPLRRMFSYSELLPAHLHMWCVMR